MTKYEATLILSGSIPMGMVLAIGGYHEADFVKAVACIIGGCLLFWVGGMMSAYLLLKGKAQGKGGN